LKREALDGFVRVDPNERLREASESILRLALALRPKGPCGSDRLSDDRARGYSLSQHGTSPPNIHMQHTPMGRLGVMHVMGEVTVQWHAPASPASEASAASGRPESVIGAEPP
jgi:hypothetical protein